MTSSCSTLEISHREEAGFTVYTTTHPPHAVDSDHEQRQRSSGHIRRLPSAGKVAQPLASSGRPSSSCSGSTVTRISRPSSYTASISLAETCDILRLIVDEEGEREEEEEVQRGLFLPSIQEEEGEGREEDFIFCNGGAKEEGFQVKEDSAELLQEQSQRNDKSGTIESRVGDRAEWSDGDFDTDLSDPEEIFETSKKKKRDAETLQIYRLACLRYKLAAKAAFERQCGQETIDMSGCLSSGRDVRPISVALQSDTDTHVLDLSSNPLALTGGSDLGHMVSRNQTIAQLNISSTRLGREGLSSVVNSLDHNSTLTSLNLSDNNLQGSDELLLARLLQKLPSLKELYLGHNSLGSPSISHFASALEEVSCSLNVLDLQYNNIRKDAGARLVQAIANNESLVSVNLSWNGLGSEGCVQLAQVLVKNQTLRELDISATRLCAHDVELLTRGLWNNSTLHRLTMSSNPMTTVGAKSLAKAVLRSKCSGLKELDLSSIPVDDDFVFMANLLDEHNSTRVIYDVTGNLLPLMDVRVTPWPKEGPDLGFYKPVTVLFEYMKLERMRIIDMFEFLDYQKRGKISMSDLRRGIHELMIPFSEHDAADLMSRLDSNNDGFISFDEFLQAYKYQYYTVSTRKARARLTKVKDGGLTDLWDMLREIIRKRRPPSNQKVTWYTLVQERWRK